MKYSYSPSWFTHFCHKCSNKRRKTELVKTWRTSEFMNSSQHTMTDLWGRWNIYIFGTVIAKRKLRLTILNHTTYLIWSSLSCLNKLTTKYLPQLLYDQSGRSIWTVTTSFHTRPSLFAKDWKVTQVRVAYLGGNTPLQLAQLCT